jgi:hypothetical protein
LTPIRAAGPDAAWPPRGWILGIVSMVYSALVVLGMILAFWVPFSG